jgi:hypothetical protein
MKNHRTTALTTAALLAGLTGCSASIHTDEYRERRPVVVEERRPVVIEERHTVERPPVIIERGAEYRHATREYLIGSSRQKIAYNAPESGVVTVVDTNTGRVEVQKSVRRGDRIAFDPVQNKAWMNGKTILDHDLDSHHVYNMYFEPR